MIAQHEKSNFTVLFFFVLQSKINKKKLAFTQISYKIKCLQHKLYALEEII